MEYVVQPAEKNLNLNPKSQSINYGYLLVLFVTSIEFTTFSRLRNTLTLRNGVCFHYFFFANGWVIFSSTKQS